MSRLNLQFTYGLGGVSDGWNDDHYLRFQVFDANTSARCRAEMDTVSEDEEASSQVIRKYLRSMFIDGKVLVDGQTVAAEEEDIEALPSPILLQLIERCSRSRFASPKVGSK